MPRRLQDTGADAAAYAFPASNAQEFEGALQSQSAETAK